MHLVAAQDYVTAAARFAAAVTERADYAEAHEHIGAACLGLDDVVHALQHYGTLQRLGSSEARDLWLKIETWLERQPSG
jgi:hypothetical protein